MNSDDLEKTYAHIIRHLSLDQVKLVESGADVSYSAKLQQAQAVYNELQQQKAQAA